MPDIDRTAPLIRGRADLSSIRTPDFDSQPACQLPRLSNLTLAFTTCR